MIKLTQPQIDLLRKATGPGGYAVVYWYWPRKNLEKLGFVRPLFAGADVIHATQDGREWLKQHDGE